MKTRCSSVVSPARERIAGTDSVISFDQKATLILRKSSVGSNVVGFPPVGTMGRTEAVAEPCQVLNQLRLANGMFRSQMIASNFWRSVSPKNDSFVGSGL